MPYHLKLTSHPSLLAGLSSAIACALQGFQVTVLERTNGASQHGDSVIIGANAVRLLYRWGVEDLWERASQGKWLVFKDQAGRTLWQEDLSAL
jgi:salicylate hydroxylase